MKKIKVLAIALILALTITGCKKEEKKEEASMTKDTTSVNSEYIHLTMVNPKTINPINNSERSVNYIMNLVYDSLFTIDNKYNTVPQLVDSYEILNDGKSIEIKLKDVKWHNGNNITSLDVEFTVNLIKQSGNSPYKPLVENISSVSILDNNTFRINFDNSYAFSIDTLTFPIVCKGELNGVKSSDIDSYRKNMVGSGPYKIAKYNQRSNMILSLNEEYYDKEKIENAKKEINVTMVPDEPTQVAMTLALSSDITRLNLSDLSQFHEKEFRINNYEGRDYEYLIFNYDNKFIKNENFRKAIAYAIDKQRILDEAYVGNATLVNFPLHSESKYYDKELKWYGYSVENAKKHLDKIKSIEEDASMGVKQEESPINNSKENTDKQKPETVDKNSTDDKNKLEEKKEFNIKEELKSLNLKIIVNKENRERVKIAYIIKENLNEIGIKSSIEELDSKSLSENLDKKDYDLALVGWELASVPDATEIIRYSGYEDEKLNSYLESLRISTNKNNTTSIYKSIQKHTRDKVAFISLAITDDYLVTNKRISGKLSPNDFDIYEGIYQIGFDK